MPMSEFVGLRAKMNCTRVQGRDTLKKAEGVKRYVLRKSITFNDFYQCIRDNCIITRAQNSIQSKLQNFFFFFKFGVQQMPDCPYKIYYFNFFVTTSVFRCYRQLSLHSIHRVMHYGSIFVSTG